MPCEAFVPRLQIPISQTFRQTLSITPRSYSEIRSLPGDPTAFRCAMVYAKRGGAWKMIAAQLVPVTETKDGGEQ